MRRVCAIGCGPSSRTVNRWPPSRHCLPRRRVAPATSIAQLALQYCSVLVDDTAARTAFWGAANFSSSLGTQGDRDLIINPLVTKAIGTATSQPDTTAVHDELNSLIGTLCTASACGSGNRTLDVAKAACGAALGNAAILVK